jgi:hypothetical protein
MASPNSGNESMRPYLRPQNLFAREIDPALPRDVVLAELSKYCPPGQGKVVVPISDSHGGVLGIAYLNYLSTGEGGGGGRIARRAGRPRAAHGAPQHGARRACARHAPPPAPRPRPGRAPAARAPAPARARLTPRAPRPAPLAAARVLERLRFTMTVRGKPVRLTYAVEPRCREHLFGPFGLRFQLIIKVRRRGARLWWPPAWRTRLSMRRANPARLAVASPAPTPPPPAPRATLPEPEPRRRRARAV